MREAIPLMILSMFYSYDFRTGKNSMRLSKKDLLKCNVKKR